MNYLFLAANFECIARRFAIAFVAVNSKFEWEIAKMTREFRCMTRISYKYKFYFIGLYHMWMERASINRTRWACQHWAPHWYSFDILTWSWILWYIHHAPIWIEMLNIAIHTKNKIKWNEMKQQPRVFIIHCIVLPLCVCVCVIVVGVDAIAADIPHSIFHEAFCSMTNGDVSFAKQPTAIIRWFGWNKHSLAFHRCVFIVFIENSILKFNYRSIKLKQPIWNDTTRRHTHTWHIQCLSWKKKANEFR